LTTEIVAGNTESSQTFVFPAILFPVPDLEPGERSLMPVLDLAGTASMSFATDTRPLPVSVIEIVVGVIEYVKSA
jgi:hypothetical protein